MSLRIRSFASLCRVLLFPNTGLDDIVFALGGFNNALYVGGYVTQTADASVTNLNNIAKSDGTSWSALLHNGLNDTVFALAVWNNPSTGTGQALYVGGALTLKNSLFAGSTGADCLLAGAIASEQNNLFQSTTDDACGLVSRTNGDIVGVDAVMRECGPFGGTTSWVCIPDATSPPIDAGDDGTCNAAPVSNKDQRDIARPFGAHCDRGSFEKVTADCKNDEKAAKPTLLKPTNNQTMSKTKVKFDWGDAVCATSYKITVKNTTTKAKVTKTLNPSKATLTLAHGKQKWTVQACNTNGCTKSKAGKFTNPVRNELGS